MNKFIQMAVMAALGVLLITTLLLPIVDNSSAETKTYTNEGSFYAEVDDATHTIVVSYDGANYSITTDGEACIMPDLSLYGSATLVYGEQGIVRLANNGYVRLAGGSTFGGYNVTSDVSVTITVSSANVAVSDGTNTKTGAIGATYYIASSGDYVLCKNPYVTNDTVIIGGFTEYTGIGLIGINGTGTVDAFNAQSFYTSLADSTLTVSNVDAVVNTTKICTNLVKIDSIVCTLTLSDDSTLTATYSYFLAPATITYENPQYAGESGVALLEIMPIILVAGLVLGIVSYSIRSRLS